MSEIEIETRFISKTGKPAEYFPPMFIGAAMAKEIGWNLPPEGCGYFVTWDDGEMVRTIHRPE